MTDQIVFYQRKDHIRESSQHVVTVTFRDRATADDVTPTNVKYRIDNLTTGATVLDWTSVSAASSVTITITPAQNAITGCDDYELRELVVAADYGLSTQYVDSMTFKVENLRGVT